jgi:DNA-directed RNA polymerase specialized sigma24 family protein
MPSFPHPSSESHEPDSRGADGPPASKALPDNLVIAPDFSLALVAAPRLASRAAAGDAEAGDELQRRVWKVLEPRLEPMIAHLRKHHRPDAVAKAGGGASPERLRRLAREAVAVAVTTWDGTGDWVKYAIVAAAKAMWKAERDTFEPQAVKVAGEALGSLNLPADVHTTLLSRQAAVAAEIDARAPEDWLTRDRLMNWQPYVFARAVEIFNAERWALTGQTEAGPPLEGEVEAIRRMARFYATKSNGTLNPELRDELESEALMRVALARRNVDPAMRYSLGFFLVAARHAMLAHLDVVRSHNLLMIWWMIEEAISSLRYRHKTEPTIDEIVAELDPAWARGKRKSPKYSRSLVCQVITMFVWPIENKKAVCAPDSEHEMADDLAIRAGLSEEEKAVMHLRIDEWAHASIAAHLGVTVARALKVQYGVRRKLRAVTKQLTPDEWRVLSLKIGEGITPDAIAALLGLPEHRVHVLWHYAAEQLRTYPELHRTLTEDEWAALNWELEGVSRAKMCARFGAWRELSALLKSGIEKLQPSPSRKRRHR